MTDLALRSLRRPGDHGDPPAARGRDHPVHRRPAFAGEQDLDPRSATDCATASTAGDDVRAAELQVFTR